MSCSTEKFHKGVLNLYKFAKLFFIAFLVFACGFFVPNELFGTTIDPLTFEELISNADFVGVVQCINSGGVIAKYRVEKSFKGNLKKGDEFFLKVPPNQYGPIFPEALAGQFFLVTAWEQSKQPPSNVTSMSFAGAPSPDPTFSKFDFSLPLFQGRFPLKKTGDGTFEFTSGQMRGLENRKFSDVEKRIETLLKEEGHEDVVLVSFLKERSMRYPDFSRSKYESDQPSNSAKEPLAEFFSQIQKIQEIDGKNARELAKKFFEAAKTFSKKTRDFEGIVRDLCRLGDIRVLPLVLDYLEKLPEAERHSMYYDLSKFLKNPEAKALIEKRIKNGLKLTGFNLDSPETHSPSPNDGKLPRAKQEEFAKKFENEILNPKPDENVVSILKESGMSAEEASKKAPPRWLMELIYLEMLDLDLRKKIGELAWKNYPWESAKENPRMMTMDIGFFAMIPNEEIQASVTAFIEKNFSSVTLSEDSKRSDEEIGAAVLESIVHLAETSPEKALPFFLKLEKLPSNRMGMFWFDGCKTLLKKATPEILQKLFEAKVPDFRLAAAVHALDNSGSMGDLSKKASSVLEELSNSGGELIRGEANLKLASRGNIESVKKLLEVFRDVDQTNLATRHRSQVVVLKAMMGFANLSFGLNQPDLSQWWESSQKAEKWKSVWSEWLEKHGAKISPEQLQKAFSL